MNRPVVEVGERPAQPLKVRRLTAKETMAMKREVRRNSQTDRVVPSS